MVTVLGVLGVLAVLFGAAAVAVRGEPVLAGAPPDAPDLLLPDTAEQVHAVRLPVAVRGYRMAEVDVVLDHLAGRLQIREQQLAGLTRELEHLRAQSAVPPMAS